MEGLTGPLISFIGAVLIGIVVGLSLIHIWLDELATAGAIMSGIYVGDRLSLIHISSTASAPSQRMRRSSRSYNCACVLSRSAANRRSVVSGDCPRR